MSLVTIQRSPSPSNTTESNCSDDGSGSVDGATDGDSCKSPQRLGLSESYLAVKGAALILPQSSCTTRVRADSNPADIQSDLQSMFYLLRPQDTLKVAVKVESSSPDHSRYMAVVATMGKQDTEESVLLGVDITGNGSKATIGMVLPIWGDTTIQLDGDGGFSVDSSKQHRVFKPVSVQAMWSAIQSVSKVRDVAAQNNYHQKGLTHTWIMYYEAHIKSIGQHVKEWTMMEDIESHKPTELKSLMGESDERFANETLIKSKLKEIMMTVDLEEVTSKYLRNKLEEDMNKSLKDYRQFIDEQMIIILRQMDAPSQIFEYLYLGSEWNASNLEELHNIEIGFILNVTREIDNFYAGIFDYKNVREFDVPQSNLLKYWEETYNFISTAKKQNSKVLVHCKMGVSRSASTVIAFAMKEYGWSLDHAYQHVKQKRSCIKPNEGFLAQLQTYEGILNASKQRHNTLWRSRSVGNLNEGSTSPKLIEDLPLTSLMMDLAADTDTRPRSWSPQDTTSRILLKTQDLAGDSSGDDIGEDCALSPENKCSKSNSQAMKQPLWDSGWDHASNSADSMEVLSDVPSPPDYKTVEVDFGSPSNGGVVLLSHRQFSEAQQDEAMGEAYHSDSELSDLENIMLEEALYRSESGYYDVGMLRSDAWLDYMEEVQDVDVLHPDIKMELLMAEQKKTQENSKAA